VSAEEELPQPEMTHDEAAAEKAARDAIELLAQHHFADALSRFDARMTAALPAGQLDDLWWYATARDGAFKAITRVTASGGLVTVRCAFQWRRRDFKVAVDPSLRIAELTALPVRDGIEWTVEPAPAAK
jgi:hypothetical protein